MRGVFAGQITLKIGQATSAEREWPIRGVCFEGSRQNNSEHSTRGTAGLAQSRERKTGALWSTPFNKTLTSVGSRNLEDQTLHRSSKDRRSACHAGRPAKNCSLERGPGCTIVVTAGSFAR